MISFRTAVILILIASLVAFGGSAYGLGKESGDQSSAGYQTATMFSIISSVSTVVSIITLLAIVYTRQCPAPA